MPFAANYMDEEDQNKNQVGGGQSINISGAQSANYATGVPGQDAGAGNKSQKSSGQYANIQSYLDANKDQADQMGTGIAQNVSQKADDATSKIKTFETKAPEVKAYDPNEAYSNLGKLSDQQKTDYRNYKSTGGYSGPATVDQVDGYQDTMKAANEASSLLKNAGTESGQQSLLRDTYKRPNYSAGENKLDQVLLQNSSGSKQALEGLSSKYSGLSGLFDQANQKVGNAVNAANTQALANKNNIVNAEKAQWDNLVNPIQSRAEQMNRDNSSIVNGMINDLNDGQEILSQANLDRLGLQSGQGLYDLDFNKYLNYDQSQIGLNQAANADERAKYQALADLVGDATRNQITADGQQVNPVSFNREAFDKDLATSKSKWDADTLAGNAPFDQELAQIQADVEAVANSGADTFWINKAIKDAEARRADVENRRNAYVASRQNFRKVNKG